MGIGDMFFKEEDHEAAFDAGVKTCPEVDIFKNYGDIGGSLLRGFLDVENVSELVPTDLKSTWTQLITNAVPEARISGYASLPKKKAYVLNDNCHNRTTLSPRGVIWNNGREDNFLSALFSVPRILTSKGHIYSSHGVALTAQIDPFVGTLLQNSNSEFSVIGRLRSINYEYGVDGETIEKNIPVIYIPGLTEAQSTELSEWSQSKFPGRKCVDFLGTKIYTKR